MEVELGQGALDHVLGHPLRHLEIAAAHRDVIEGDDPDEALAVDDRQPPHPVLDHQRRRFVELHLRLAADQRTGGVLAYRRLSIDALGEDAQRQVAVGDHRHRRAGRIDEYDRADPVIAHQACDRKRAGVGFGGDNARGHDLVEPHWPYATAHEQTAAHPRCPARGRSRPDNPPCPACGEPLFGWVAPQPGLGGAVSRCESCGLGAIGEPGDTDDALRELDRTGAGSPLRIANRASIAASLGSAGWAGLEPGARYLFTVEAVRRLVAVRDQVVDKHRWAPGAGIAAMWQTNLNSLTFGHNIALGALGRGEAVAAEHRWQRRIDA